MSNKTKNLPNNKNGAYNYAKSYFQRKNLFNDLLVINPTGEYE